MTIQDAEFLVIARRPGSGALFCILFMLSASPRAGMAADFWTATGGPYGGTVISVLAASDDRVFAGTEGGGLYRSADGGDTWTATELKTGSVLALAVSEGGEFFAGTRAGTVWHSTDGGNTWSEVGQLWGPLFIEALLPDADTSGALLAATQGDGIFRSVDGGQNWTATGLNGVTVRSLHRTPQGLLLAGSDDGLRQSTDGGLTWSPAGLENGPIPALSSGSSVGLLAATPTGVFRSVDGGQSWELTALEGFILALMVDGENGLFAASESGIFRSSDLGESWTQVYDGTSEIPPFAGGTQFALAGTDKTLYAGTSDGVLRSTSGGDSWSPVNTGLGATWIQALASHNDLAVFAGTAGSGVFTAAAFGEGLPQGGTGGGPWTSAGLANGHISALGVQNNVFGVQNNVFAGAGGLYSRSYQSQPPPWSITGGSSSWIPVSDDLHFVPIHALHIASDWGIFAGTQTGVYRSLTGSWEASGLADSPIFAFAEHPNGDLFAGGPDGLFRSPDNGDTWESFVAGLEGTIQALAINADGEVVAGTPEGIFRSPPDAPAFSAQNEGLTVTEGSGNSIFALVATLNGQLFAGHLGGGVFRSIDGGDTWEAVNEGMTHTDIRALILATDGHLYAGSAGGGVFRSVESQGPAPLPDLLVLEANFLGAPFLPGQQGVEVVLNFQNQAPATATQNLNQLGFDVRVEVMTPDGEIFQVIEEFQNSLLNVGVVLGLSFSFDLPGGGPQGAYKVVATIDPEEVIEEADETNNTLVASFEVASKPPFSNSAIAFASNRNGPTLDIYTMTADGSGPTQLTNAKGNDFLPDWSRNGKQIAFKSQRDGPGEIYVMDIDGENEIRVTENTTDDYSPSWAPDGERIAFQSQDAGLPSDEIYAINVDGTGAVNLTDHPAHDVQPDWSPDGERIAFSSDRDGGLYVFLMDADGGNVTNLTGSLGLPGQNSAWSPDGEQIALSSGGDIVVVDPDGGQGSVVVYESPKWASSPTWSPDGQWIAFAANKDGDDEIYAVSLKGNVLVKLTENSFKDVGPSWSPSPLPDLAWKGELEVVGEDGDPPPFDLGELITFTGTIVNQGAGLAEGFAVEAELTGPPDETVYFGAGLILIGLTLAAGEEIAFQHSFQLPSQAPGGNYQLTVILDPKNVVGESDEIAATLPAAKLVALAQERRSTIGANNSIVRSFEVSGPPTEGESTAEAASQRLLAWVLRSGEVFGTPAEFRVNSLLTFSVYRYREDDLSDTTQITDFVLSLPANLGTVSGSRVRLNTVAGVTGAVRVTAGGLSTNYRITTAPSSIDHLEIRPADVRIASGTTIDFNARGVDRFGNTFTLSGVNVGWHVVPPELGTIHSRTGVLSATTPGVSGYVIAVVSGSLRFGDSAASGEGVSKVTVLGQIPQSFALLPNYPNPFNPETTIRFDLPTPALVEVSAYNLAGQRVETLVSELMPAGSHSVVWFAGEHPSGVYVIRLATGELSETQKVLLAK